MLLPQTFKAIEYLPLPDMQQVAKRVIGIAPGDLSDAVESLEHYLDAAVLFPLLRSKNAHELDLQWEQVVPVYAGFYLSVSWLVSLAFQNAPSLLIKHVEEAHSDFERLIDERGAEKMGEQATINSLAAISGARRIAHQLWPPTSDDLAKLMNVPHQTQQAIIELSIKMWLCLNCILYILNDELASVAQEVIDELAYRARCNAQAWHSLLSQTGLLSKVEADIPAERHSDEEEQWLAEAGIQEWAEQLDK
jgi:hypothetical protein